MAANQKDNPQDQEDNTASIPPIPPGPNETKPTQQSQDQIKDEVKPKKFTISSPAVANGIQIGILIITFLTLVAFICSGMKQAEFTRQSLEYTKSSNASTEKSIKIAYDNLNLARQNANIENRAWVGIADKETPHGYLDDIDILLKNFGKTPAENVRFGEICFELKDKIPKNIKPSWQDLGIMSPTESVNVTIKSPTFTKYDSVEAKLGAGKIKFIYYGIVIYGDIYGGSDTTEFMFLYHKKDLHALFPMGVNRMK